MEHKPNPGPGSVLKELKENTMMMNEQMENLNTETKYKKSQTNSRAEKFDNLI